MNPNSLSLRSCALLANLGSSTPPYIGPLDAFTTNLVGSWSVARRLLTSYTGPLIRVRESAGNTELDIVADSNGNLDTATLLAFTDVNDGFITKVYDQSTLSDLVQATSSKQPKIVDGGVVNTLNSHPCAVFNGTSNHLESVCQLGVSFSNYSFYQLSGASFFPMVHVLIEGGVEMRGNNSTGLLEVIDGGSNLITLSSIVGVEIQTTWKREDSVDFSLRINSSDITTGTGIASASACTVNQIGARGGAFFAPMNWGELIQYDISHDAGDTTSLEAIQNAFWV